MHKASASPFKILRKDHFPLNKDISRPLSYLTLERHFTLLITVFLNLPYTWHHAPLFLIQLSNCSSSGIFARSSSSEDLGSPEFFAWPFSILLLLTLRRPSYPWQWIPQRLIGWTFLNMYSHSRTLSHLAAFPLTTSNSKLCQIQLITFLHWACH